MKFKSKSAYLSTRTTDLSRVKFHAKAYALGLTPSDALRELIDAFVEDRVTIQPRVIRNPLEKPNVT